jgi:hypothetical protein
MFSQVGDQFTQQGRLLVSELQRRPSAAPWQKLCVVPVVLSLHWLVEFAVRRAVAPGIQPGGVALRMAITLENSRTAPGGKLPPSAARRMPAKTYSW